MEGSVPCFISMPCQYSERPQGSNSIPYSASFWKPGTALNDITK